MEERREKGQQRWRREERKDSRGGGEKREKTVEVQHWKKDRKESGYGGEKRRRRIEGQQWRREQESEQRWISGGEKRRRRAEMEEKTGQRGEKYGIEQKREDRRG